MATKMRTCGERRYIVLFLFGLNKPCVAGGTAGASISHSWRAFLQHGLGNGDVVLVGSFSFV